MSPRPGPHAVLLSLVGALLLTALVAAGATPAHASDDSNSGQLKEVPTLTPQQLDQALGQLSQGTNDTKIQQLVSQFEFELNSGNYSAASQTLIQLKADSGASGSQSFYALLQSLSVGSDGASINAATLSSLLSPDSPAGPGTATESPQQLSIDMQSIANLMKYANSTLASQLLQNSGSLGGTPFQSGVPSPGGAPIAAPGLGGLSGLSVPSVGAPSLGVGAPGGVPNVPIFAFIVPIVAAAAVGALLLFRGRVSRLVGSQSLPGMPGMGRVQSEAEFGPAPSDPRQRIEYYFGKTSRLMARRGVPKLDSETHREFSTKCEPRPERPHVSTVSTLYEKAKFSGQRVENPEADLAASAFGALDREER